MPTTRCEVKARMDSVKTALKVLEQLALAAPAGVSDLARAIDAPKSTIQRDLTTLHEAGWIRPVVHQGRRRWTLSAKILTLARGLQPALRLRDIALPAIGRAAGTDARDDPPDAARWKPRRVDRAPGTPQTLRTVRQPRSQARRSTPPRTARPSSLICRRSNAPPIWRDRCAPSPSEP